VDRAADEFVVTVLALMQEAEGQQDEAAVRDTFQRSQGSPLNLVEQG